MNQAIKIAISGIKCDNKSCDFIDQSVTIQDFSSWLNKPCPKCGANLFTQKDYDSLTEMLLLTGTLNKILPPTKLKDAVCNPIKMNGTGKMKLENSRKEK